MPLKEKLVEGLKFYFWILSLSLAIVLLGSFAYATVTRTPFFETFRGAMLIAVFLIVIVGFASLLPFSEYHYRDPLNPVAKREWLKAIRKGRESRAWAVCLALVGFTLLLIYFVMFPY